MNTKEILEKLVVTLKEADVELTVKDGEDEETFRVTLDHNNGAAALEILLTEPDVKPFVSMCLLCVTKTKEEMAILSTANEDTLEQNAAPVYEAFVNEETESSLG